MNTTRTADETNHQLYLMTISAKAMLGALQLATAFLLYFGALQNLPSFARWLVQNELAENPSDFIALKILQFAGRAPEAGLSFYTVYFAAHGLLHIAVVAALLGGARWAYHAAIIVLAVFVIYQLFEWMAVGGAMLIVLSVIDLAVIYLTVQDRRRERRKQH